MASSRFLTSSVSRASVAAESFPFPLSFPLSFLFSSALPRVCLKLLRVLWSFSPVTPDFPLAVAVEVEVNDKFSPGSALVNPRTKASNHRTRSSSAKMGSTIALVGGGASAAQACPSCSSRSDRGDWSCRDGDDKGWEILIGLLPETGGEDGGDVGAELPVGEERWRMRFAWRSPRNALPMFAIRSVEISDLS
jgi:hypothetical protein